MILRKEQEGIGASVKAAFALLWVAVQDTPIATADMCESKRLQLRSTSTPQLQRSKQEQYQAQRRQQQQQHQQQQQQKQVWLHPQHYLLYRCYSLGLRCLGRSGHAISKSATPPPASASAPTAPAPAAPVEVTKEMEVEWRWRYYCCLRSSSSSSDSGSSSSCSIRTGLPQHTLETAAAAVGFATALQQLRSEQKQLKELRRKPMQIIFSAVGEAEAEDALGAAILAYATCLGGSYPLVGTTKRQLQRLRFGAGKI